MTVLVHEVTSGAVVITGGAGYIGSHTVLACRAVGRPVVVLDDLSRGNRRLLPADVPFYEGDAGDPSMLATIVERHPLEAVLPFACAIVVPESIAAPLSYSRNNPCKTTHMTSDA